MKGIKQIKLVDPREKIWGFHTYQELPLVLLIVPGS